MITLDLESNKVIRKFREIGSAAFLIFVFGLAVFAQANENSQNGSPTKSPESETKRVPRPVFTNYKGLSIGSSRDEVKEKLGKPKIEDDDGFYFLLSRDEQVQVRLDENKKVSVIAITYSGNSENAPKYEDVFGTDIPLVTRPDGSSYNLIRYPEAGMWVAYSKTVGDEPTVTVTMQKL
jgi:hypothetical protein